MLKKNVITNITVLVLLALFSFYLFDQIFQKPNIKQASIKQVNSSLPVVFAQSLRPVTKAHIPVLMYHRIGAPPDTASADLTVSIADFEAQVKYFFDSGFKTVSLAQVYDAFLLGAPLPERPIVFTFDDGYKDAFENAIPILKKYYYTGSFAVATQLLGRPGYAAWEDVLRARNDSMEIISHTQNHLDLTNPVYSDVDLRREIFDSKKILEERLGIPVDFFVYPYGRYNYRVGEFLVQAGYKMAFTTAFGLNLSKDHLLVEPRVRVHGQNGLEKLKKIFE